jgi:hypothetical protein
MAEPGSVPQGPVFDSLFHSLPRQRQDYCMTDLTWSARTLTTALR